jgi:hypothetical protein
MMNTYSGSLYYEVHFFLRQKAEGRRQKFELYLITAQSAVIQVADRAD